MSLTYITGAITIAPPITWDEISSHITGDSASADERLPYHHDGLTPAVEVGDLLLRLEPGTQQPEATRQAAAITGEDDEPCRGNHITDALNQIITDFASEPDGTARTFTGHLECDDGHGHDWRVYVRDGQARAVDPEIRWHEPAGRPCGPTDPDVVPDRLYVEIFESVRYLLPVTADDTSDWAGVAAAVEAADTAIALSEQATEDLHALAADHPIAAELHISTEREFGAITTEP